MSIVVNKTRLPVTEWQTKSGAIVSIDDARQRLARSLKVHMLPHQDLHGYDNPWPAGGGVNKFDPNSTDDTWVGIGGSISHFSYTKSCTIPTTGGTTWTLSNTNASSANNILLLSFFDSSDSLLSRHPQSSGATSITATAPTDTAYVIASFYHWDMVQNAQLESGSTATSYAPYSNICPISGWTKANLNVTGTNVWDEELEIGSIDSTNGQNTTSSSSTRSKNYIPTVPLTTYYKKVPNDLQVLFYDADKNYLGYGVWGHDTTFTTPSNAYFMRFKLGSSYGTTYQNNISINYPATDHDYHAYTGTPYTIQFGQTVYGGTLDVVSGELVVTKKLTTIRAWSGSFGSTNNGFAVYRTLSDRQVNSDTICNMFVRSSVGYSNMPVGTYLGSSGTNTTWSFILPSTVTSKEEADTWLSNLSEPLVVTETLATPITFHLTPQQIQMLVRNNTIWSDADSVEVEYAAIHSH